jgi:hypothetical protein
MNDEDRLRVAAPVFLLRSSASCWRCHVNQEVIALAFRWCLDKDLSADEQPQKDEPLILENIHEMPEAILAYLISVHPHFEKRTSKTAGIAYYMNTCDCGAHFGDFYLFNEPGGAFFPTDEAEAGNITIEQLPFTGTFEFDCSYGMGTGDLIFQHGKRQAPR